MNACASSSRFISLLRRTRTNPAAVHRNHPPIAFVQSEHARSLRWWFRDGHQLRLSLRRVLDDDLVSRLRELQQFAQFGLSFLDAECCAHDHRLGSPRWQSKRATGFEQLVEFPEIERLNIGSVSTMKISWAQPPKALFEFL